VDQNSWTSRLHTAIATELRYQRKLKRQSAQALANRTGEIGLLITRNTLAGIENKNRLNFPVSELLVLSAALDISPMQLVAPVGRLDTAELLPGVEMPVFEAARWWRGDRRKIL
jgi:transcriptional regulator with XRE-family HTH domain